MDDFSFHNDINQERPQKQKSNFVKGAWEVI